VGHPVDEPARRELLHPGPDQGNELAGEIEAKISVSERIKHVLSFRDLITTPLLWH
jgi:hypothetical protein